MRVLPRDDVLSLIKTVIHDQPRPEGDLRILDAGCGSFWRFDMTGVPYRLTGVDVDRDSIEKRRAAERPEETLICSDLHSADLPEASFDLIYNCYVMEHVDRAEVVLENFARWLAPGGVIVLRMPDPAGVYGHMAKMLPFSLHVFYKRHIAGMKHAGEPGYGPFPTIYDDIVCVEGIRDFCARRGLEIVEEIGYGGAPFPGRPRLQKLIETGLSAIAALTFGRLHNRHRNLLYIIRKPVTAAKAA